MRKIIAHTHLEAHMFRILLTLSLFLTATPAFSGDPTFYVRKATWNETMLASREALSAYRAPVKDIRQSLLSPWKYIGPFHATSSHPFDEVFPPEKGLVFDSTYGGLRWTERVDWNDRRVTDLGSDTMVAHYLYRTLSVPRDTTILLSLGSDDGIIVWINGGKVVSHNTERGAGADQEVFGAFLHAGKNTLLVKISNHYGPSGFYFEVQDLALRQMWDLVQRDFSDAKSLKEMRWELADSIWECEWAKGDVLPLCMSYADKTPCETFAQYHALGIKARIASTYADLAAIRAVYIQLKEQEIEGVVLTPPTPRTPRINWPRKVGVRPTHPFLFTVPISGARPLKVTAKGLPAGLSIDSRTGVITGSVKEPGTYPVEISATNAKGKTKGTITIVVGQAIALTPPLGWNSWNCFAQAVDDRRVRSAADAMIARGLNQHGWTYINIDDCWEIKPGSTDSTVSGEPRDTRGFINTNKKFPNMHDLSSYIHAKGLKMGIYSSPGPLTCAGYTASYGHELHDAQQYAAWGIDYLKYDWCSYGRIAKDQSLPELKKPYFVMRSALDSVERDIVYSLCQYGMGKVWEWGATVGGNSWRTTGDIEDTWESMAGIGFSQAGHEAHAGPGHWNDPDMLVVGKVGWGPHLHPTRLTANEQYTHISLWCLLSSPLLIGCDMTQLDKFTLGLLTNDEVLAVSQDGLGKQARRVSQSGELEVWAKEMEDGSYAVGLFNRGRWQHEVAVKWQDLGLTGQHAVRDLWRQKDLGKLKEQFSALVPRHGVVLVRVR
jgi:alpha-galactosidase